eukprot:scaffold34310_cov31-Tisochrysis_lutea.AAC.6
MPNWLTPVFFVLRDESRLPASRCMQRRGAIGSTLNGAQFGVGGGTPTAAILIDVDFDIPDRAREVQQFSKAKTARPRWISLEVEVLRMQLSIPDARLSRVEALRATWCGQSIGEDQTKGYYCWLRGRGAHRTHGVAFAYTRYSHSLSLSASRSTYFYKG